MAVKKLRGVAKKIKGDKAFKKLIANFLTDVDMSTGNYDIRDMLMVGNRGWLARSEKELCSTFDKYYDDIASKKITIFDNASNTWCRRDPNEMRKKYLKKGDMVYDEVFEKYVLEE